MSEPVELTELERVYDFGTHTVTIVNIRELFVSESGNHRLKTADGKLHIIAPGWFAIHINDGGKGWTV